ncbi:MAG TPA: L-rhamnose isomerase [Lentisphaeria bacterium]|jgi:L-rhamnose isomerase|nr:L-rhamnose isomerase [Lentisphaeria bacterium]
MPSPISVESQYKLAQARYAELGIDTDAQLRALSKIPISLHCWQGDDVAGFESGDGLSGGGILATGNYPGRARTAGELRGDLNQAFALIPGRHRVNLHAIYAETGGQAVDRAELEPCHFQGWVDWARATDIGVDFNQSFFSHPNADDGFTLAHLDPAIRDYWIAHGRACRRIADWMGRELGSPPVTNVWIPDGFKDTPIDRRTRRELLVESLDAMFAESLPNMRDAVECKLFGIGSESCVIGSHEFYLGYAVKNQKMLCLDAGHFHPTEVISDKISSVLLYLDELLLHVSRGVRWDSDHVVTLDNELIAIASEIVRNRFLGRVNIGLDFFDASINRIAAWVIGTRNMIKALLIALLEPTDSLRSLEEAGNYTDRLVMLEELKSMPWGAVWDYYCLQQEVPVGPAWINDVRSYENDVLLKRMEF